MSAKFLTEGIESLYKEKHCKICQNRENKVTEYNELGNTPSTRFSVSVQCNITVLYELYAYKHEKSYITWNWVGTWYEILIFLKENEYEEPTT